MVDEAPDAGEVLRLLASHERLRVVAALVLGARTTEDVVSATSLPSRVALEALGRLETGGLLARDGDGWVLLTERFAEARPAATTPDVADYPGVPQEAAVVLQRFIRGGRLLSIPSQRSKRLIVLDHLAHTFEPGRRYTEREVSEQLATIFDDYAALRRYLVDEGYLSRDAGVYWRSGGTVDV